MKQLAITLTLLSLLFLTHMTFIYGVESTSLVRSLNEFLHWRYVHQFVFFFCVPILALILLRRNPVDYGIIWNRFVFLSILVILTLTLALPIAVDAAVGQLTPVKATAGYLLSTLVFQTIFSGCGEELAFRGMYQGEVNRVAGKHFRIGATRFGSGVFVGALFFALGHAGIPGAMDGGSLSLMAMVYAGVIGLFLGFVREFVGSVFIVGFLHAAMDTYSYLVQPSAPGRVVHFVAIGAVCFLLFNQYLHAGKQASAPSDATAFSSATAQNPSSTESGT